MNACGMMGAERRREGERERETRGDGAKWEDKGDGTRVEVLLCFRLGGVLCGIEDGRLKIERACRGVRYGSGVKMRRVEARERWVTDVDESEGGQEEVAGVERDERNPEAECEDWR